MKRQIEELEDTLQEEQRRERAEEKERKKAEKEAREQEEKERERVAQENNIEPPKKRKSKRELRKEKEGHEKFNAEVDQAQQGSGQPDSQPDSEPFPPSVESDTGESITPKSESRSERKRRLRAEQKQKKLRKLDEEPESNTTASADIDEPPKTKKRKRELRKEKLAQEQWKQQQLEAQGEGAPLQTQTEADVQSTEIPKPKLSKKKRELRREKLAQEKWKKEVAEKERQSQIAAIEREARKKQKELDALRVQEQDEQTQPAPNWKKKLKKSAKKSGSEVADPAQTTSNLDPLPDKLENLPKTEEPNQVTEDELLTPQKSADETSSTGLSIKEKLRKSLGLPKAEASSGQKKKMVIPETADGPLCKDPDLSCSVDGSTGAWTTDTNTGPLYKENAKIRAEEYARPFLNEKVREGGFIYNASERIDLRGECVSLVKAVASVGATWTWEKGNSLGQSNPYVEIGTPVATFDTDGKYPGEGRLRNGSFAHTGIFLGYSTDNNGQIDGMYLLDQFQAESPPKKAGVSWRALNRVKKYSVVR